MLADAQAARIRLLHPGFTYVYSTGKKTLGSEHAGASDTPDLLLSAAAEELGLHDDWLGRELALAEHLEVSGLGDVDDGNLAALGLGCAGALLLRDKSPQEVQVDGGAELLVLGVVEVPHTHLSEVTRMVLVEEDSVVVLATSVTTTTRVAPVLANATMAGRHVSPLLPVLVLPSRLHAIVSTDRSRPESR